VFRNAFRIVNGSLLALLLLPVLALSQTPSPGIRGQVLDPSGAAVPAINIELTGPNGVKLEAQTDDQGKYAFHNLAPGTYTVTIQLKGFNDFVQTGVIIGRGQSQVVNASLSVALEKQQITVTDETTKVEVNPSDNASALVIKGKDLESLSDDPDELQSELEALAGPSAGPNGGQIYIDGFTGGQLPPKSSIREIRVNQNPFSSQYDSLGYGRIEILTKPGTEKLHGQAFVSGNDSAFNTRNPFATQIPGYHTEIFNGNVGGPINKKTSFFFDGQHRDIEDDAIVNAIVLDQSLNQTSFVQAVPTPQTQTNASARIDTQLGTNDTLTVRYSLWQNGQTNSGVGQFSLPSAGYNYGERYQSIQMSEAHVINEKAVTELRFRFYRDDEHQNPAGSAPAIAVLGAFNGGGSTSGSSTTNTNAFELQDYTSVSLSKHFIKFGARMRDDDQATTSNANFNGTFTFQSLNAYQITEQGLQANLTPAQIQANGGGASQFTLTTGTPRVAINYLDFEPYVEDDWKVRHNLTISGGLRFETQTHIHDHADFAPRVGLAWGLGGGKSPKMVLRAGFGVFYDRFGQDYITNAARFNGTNQQQYVIPDPNFFPNIPSPSTFSASAITSTNYQVDPNLRTPYTSQAGIGLERQITKKATVSVTYLNTHGVHQLITRNINAPDPANLNDARPNPSLSNIYQYESAGLYNQNQMIANFRVNGSKVSVFGFYTLSHADSNTAGNASFPMNQYNLEEDYGRAAYDVRNRLFVGGSWNLRHGFQINPFVVVNSAPPFNITLSNDLGGNYLPVFNARPSFAASPTEPNAVNTRWGILDTQPVPGEKLIPMNLGTGFNQFTANLRFSKTFSFGKEVQGGSPGGPGGGGPRGGHGLGGGGLSSMGQGGNMFGGGNTSNRRFNLTFSVSARNIFNTVNDAPPVGNLDSPIFGKANSLAGGFFSSSAANRRIDLQVRFSF